MQRNTLIALLQSARVLGSTRMIQNFMNKLCDIILKFFPPLQIAEFCQHNCYKTYYNQVLTLIIVKKIKIIQIIGAHVNSQCCMSFRSLAVRFSSFMITKRELRSGSLISVKPPLSQKDRTWITTDPGRKATKKTDTYGALTTCSKPFPY